MKPNVIKFPLSDHMQPEQVLAVALEEAKQGAFESVLITGYTSDGKLFTIVSKVMLADAVFALEVFKDSLIRGSD